MSEYLLMAFAGFVVLIAGGGILLWRELKNLKQEYRLLADQLRRNNEDVAGLCSAAVAVDQYLAANEARLNSVVEMVNTHSSAPPPPPPPRQVNQSASKPDEEPEQGYDNAIKNIRRGAGVDDLVKDYGLTRDEAVLLFRLHGGKR